MSKFLRESNSYENLVSNSNTIYVPYICLVILYLLAFLTLSVIPEWQSTVNKKRKKKSLKYILTSTWLRMLSVLSLLVLLVALVVCRCSV